MRPSTKYGRIVSFGVAEFVVAALAVALAVVVVLAISGQLSARSSRSGQDSKTISLPEQGDAWLGRMATSLSGLSAHRVEWSSPTTLELYWARRPAWTFVVAVFFFPVGLLAFLVTRTVVGTFDVVASGPPASVRVAGDFSQVAVDVVNRAIPD
jgi:hypothetical protein